MNGVVTVSAVPPSEAARRLVSALCDAQRADGAWGAYPGRPGSTESTAFALLALATADAAVPQRAAVARARRWLVARQHADGGWPATEEVRVSSWPTAPAVLALARLALDGPSVDRGLDWLLAREGVHANWRERLQRWLFTSKEDRKINDLDISIPGWPWVEGTFSWVEPTALAVLALRAAARVVPSRRSDIAVRIDDGVRLLVDRAVPGGGWNYGNRRVFEGELEAYPDTTAWALLALSGIPSASAVAAPALDTLVAQMRGNRSALARALAVLALRAHGRDASALQEALAAQCAEGGADPAPVDARSRALALLALASPAVLVTA